MNLFITPVTSLINNIFIFPDKIDQKLRLIRLIDLKYLKRKKPKYFIDFRKENLKYNK